MCPSAQNLATGVVNGVVYTKRNRDQISALLNANLPGLDTTCTSGITDMSQLFFSETVFNTTIESWDVSIVTDMSYMFFKARSFNQDIGAWDVSRV